MSQKGIERMAMVFSNLQTANYDLLQMATDKEVLTAYENPTKSKEIG